jgi:glycosyltransferase involved in cell wall biosynthesis
MEVGRRDAMFPKGGLVPDKVSEVTSTQARAHDGASRSSPALRRGGSRTRILVLCPFPHGLGPSQRFRFEQYLGAWRQEGHEVVQASFWDVETLSILYQRGFTQKKVRGFLRGLGRQLRAVLATGSYDYAFVHLAAVPAGPPLIEAVCLLRGWRVIFDIDDAIFLGVASHANPLARVFRSGAYVEYITKRAEKVVVVNPFLEAWARRLNDDVRLIPTTIDPEYHRPRPDRRSGERVVLGWTGTFTTNAYLDILRPALVLLQEERDFTLRVISNVDPEFPELRRYEFVKWRKETEIEDLWPIDVGLMPLDRSTVSMGKVGFKAIQFAALEVPSVVSDEGSGRQVVEDGVTGFVLSNDTASWVAALRRLIDDPALRARLGAAARARILARYSIPAQLRAYCALVSD